MASDFYNSETTVINKQMNQLIRESSDPFSYDLIELLLRRNIDHRMKVRDDSGMGKGIFFKELINIMNQDRNMYNSPYPPYEGYQPHPTQQPAGYASYPPQPGGGYGQNEMPFQAPPVMPRPGFPKGWFYFNN
ncbi:unnamed protein product [Rotaria sordida]|uniref:Uncharacterized protein n=1 Tax=Rotaria sordida TaxID=392033 RepID=A0A819KG85_9BILA|nr:unnamed protein product [Rotaria sordida]